MIHLLTPHALTWGWTSVFGLTIFAGSTALGFATFIGALVNIPLMYMCFNKWTRVLPVLIFVFYAITNIIFPWLYHPHKSAALMAVILNLTTLSIYGGLIFSALTFDFIEK